MPVVASLMRKMMSKPCLFFSRALFPFFACFLSCYCETHRLDLSRVEPSLASHLFLNFFRVKKWVFAFRRLSVPIALLSLFFFCFLLVPRLFRAHRCGWVSLLFFSSLALFSSFSLSFATKQVQNICRE